MNKGTIDYIINFLILYASRFCCVSVSYLAYRLLILDNLIYDFGLSMFFIGELVLVFFWTLLFNFIFNLFRIIWNGNMISLIISVCITDFSYFVYVNSFYIYKYSVFSIHLYQNIEHFTFFQILVNPMLFILIYLFVKSNKIKWWIVLSGYVTNFGLGALL